MAFGAELRDVIGEIAGTEAPASEGDPLLFYGQWLAGRNLGLVPVDDASGFEWPGPWIARVQAGDGEHAVLMFGAPPGPLSDPSRPPRRHRRRGSRRR